MSKLSQFSGSILKSLKANSPLILSVAAGVGTLTTAFLVGKASFEAANKIRDFEEENPPAINPRERLKERTQLVWKLYIPPAISTVSTIVCIVGAKRMETRKTIAASLALDVAERAYADYRNKVVEEYGPSKDIAIRDKVVADQVANKPPPSNEVLMIGSGEVLCCELFTMRYFSCNIEKLRRSVNEINSKALKHDYATLDDLYYILGLQPTTGSNNIGWTSDKLMEFVFSTALTEDGRPCLTFEYNYTKQL